MQSSLLCFLIYFFPCTFIYWTKWYVSISVFAGWCTHTCVVLKGLHFSCKIPVWFTLFSRVSMCQSCDTLSQLTRDWRVTESADLYGEVRICHCAAAARSVRHSDRSVLCLHSSAAILGQPSSCQIQLWAWLCGWENNKKRRDAVLT